MKTINLLFIFCTLLSIISCDTESEIKQNESIQNEKLNALSNEVEKMVTQTIQDIIAKNPSELEMLETPILFDIVKNYNTNINFSCPSTGFTRASDNALKYDPHNFSKEQNNIITKLIQMAERKNINFEEIKYSISLLPQSDQKEMFELLAIVKGGTQGIDKVKENMPMTRSKASTIICNANTGGIGAIWGAWSGAIAGAYWGTLAGGFVGTAVGIVSGAVLGAYLC